MMAPLQIKVLGELAVLRDGREVVLPASRKTRALLAYLAVVNRRQRRDYLCQMFWNVPDDPRASLRWSLSKLRHLMDTGCLQADRDTVFLDANELDLDVASVNRIAAKDLPALATADLEALDAGFRGRFLEGLDLPRCPAFESWRAFHAEALDRTRVLILRMLVERLRDEPERALPFARKLKEMGSGDPGLPLQAISVAADEKPRHFEPSQDIRYCRSPDGVRIAYGLSGNGPPLLRAAHWMSHLQYEWESPVWRHWIDALSAENTLIRYDQRGNGLSDWEAADLTLAAMVCDLESVADASGLDDFPLLGVSQSCAVSVAYAVRHPERVSHLVLYGGYAKGWRRG
jgi:hypothetical protein